MLHEVCQEGKTNMVKQEEHDQSLNHVRIKYVILADIKSVILTKLESSTSQRKTKITYKIDYRVDGNLMPFMIFKCPFPQATIGSLHTTKNSSVILKYITIQTEINKAFVQSD